LTPRYMLDTDICIHIARGRPAEVKVRFGRLRPDEVMISTITYGELCFGARKSSLSADAFAQLEIFTQDVAVAPLDWMAGAKYGEIRAALERQGRVIGNNDLWIAAHALALGVVLATSNEREFGRIPGLRVENWAK